MHDVERHVMTCLSTPRSLPEISSDRQLQDEGYRGLVSLGIAAIGGSANSAFKEPDVIRYKAITASYAVEGPPQIVPLLNQSKRKLDNVSTALTLNALADKRNCCIFW